MLTLCTICSPSAHRCCACQPLVLLLLLLLTAVLQLPGASSSPAASLSTPQGPAAPADCQLVVQGGDKGGISKATLTCKGGTVTVGGNERALGRFRGSFQGVTWDKGCVWSGCLLVVCGHSHATFTDSSIQGVQQMDNVTQMLCIRDDSRVRLQSSLFVNNRGRAVATDNRAALTVVGSRITGNTAIWAGAGIGVLGNSSLLLDGGSVLAGNTAVNASGGGLAVMDSASMVVAGRSVVSNNSVEGFCGAGIYVGDSASLVVRGGSRIIGNRATRGGGGGVCVGDVGRASVEGDITIAENTSHKYNGGGVTVLGNGSLVLSGAVRVALNRVVNASGGGLAATDNGTVVINRGVVVTNNTAVNFCGGGVYVRSSAKLTMRGAHIVNNLADHGGGGGLCVDHQASVQVLDRSKVSGNVVKQFSGGGVSIFSNASLLLAGESEVSGNQAVNASGGGISVNGNGTLLINSKAVVANNSCSNFCGGGIYVRDNASLTVHGSSVVNNTARKGGGGGMCVDGKAALVVAGNSRVAGNTARDYSGGGVAVLETSSMTLTGGSIIAYNQVVNASGGGLDVEGNATAVVEGNAVVQNNTASDACGGGIFITNFAILELRSSLVAGNQAHGGSGGGVCLSGRARVIVSGGGKILHNTCHNRSGGGVSVLGNASFVLGGGGIIAHNQAVNGSGGGLGAEFDASVMLRNGSVLANNTALSFCGGGSYVRDSAVLNLEGAQVSGNLAVNGSGGAICGDVRAKLDVRGNSRISGNNCRNGMGGGVALLGNSSLLLTGESVVSHNRAHNGSGGGIALGDQSELVVSGRSLISHNAASFYSGGGVFANKESSVLITGETVLARNQATKQGGGALAACGVSNVVVSGRTLVANNSADSGGGLTVFENATMLVTGGTEIVGNDPLGSPGGAVWAGDTSSVNITDGVVFRRNIPGVFSYGKNVFLQVAARLHMDDSITDEDGVVTKCSNSVYMKLDACSAGEYKAIGACRCCPMHTYSLTNNGSFACSACPAFAVCPGGDAVLPIPGYYHSSPKSVQMHLCPLATSACAGRGQCQPGYTGNLCGSCAPGYGMTLPLKCSQCMSPARQLGAYLGLSLVAVLFIVVTLHFAMKDNRGPEGVMGASDAIKVLVQFLQILTVLGSVSAPWPAALQVLFAVASVMIGAPLGQVVSPDCWLSRTTALPLAINRKLIVYLSPLAVAAAVVAVLLAGQLVMRFYRKLAHVLCSQHMPSVGLPDMSLMRQLPAALLIVVYFAFPTLVQSSLSFFACLPIDNASKGPYAEFAVNNHTSGYFVWDMEQECFTCWHKAWGFGLGLPAVLLLCVGVPLFLLWFFKVNQAKCSDATFRARYGFLYHSYTGNKLWWDAVWAFQMVLLCAVAAFHHIITPYHALILLSFACVVGAVAHVIARPNAFPTIHRMQLAAMACLFFTSYAPLTLFVMYDAQASNQVNAAVAIVLLCLNCAFALWCVWVVVASTSSACLGLQQRVGNMCKHWWPHQECSTRQHDSVGSMPKHEENPTVA